ncbi:MAG TPA: hypothetical protein VH593_07655 [Ktedonobacteraceae bacterium]
MAMMLAAACEKVSHSVVAARSGKYEFICWSDGSLTVEDWRYQFTQDNTLDHVALPANVVRTLRKFMNVERVVKFLEHPIPFDNATPTHERMYSADEFCSNVEMCDALQHEFVCHRDGTTTLDHWMFSPSGCNPDFDNCQLPLEASRALRSFLNREQVMLAIGVNVCCAECGAIGPRENAIEYGRLVEDANGEYKDDQGRCYRLAGQEYECHACLDIEIANTPDIVA